MTPPDIVPEWYLLPFYAMLRSIPNKLIGVIVMVGSLVTLVFIPWLDTSPGALHPLPPADEAVLLGLRGGLRDPGLLRLAERGRDAAVAPRIPLVWVARIATLYYFAFFWLIMPLVGLIETPKPLPASIAQSVLGPRRVRMTDMKALPTRTRWPLLAVVAGLRAAPPTSASRCRPRTCTGRSKARSAPMTAPPCSAASRSTRKSARPVTA